MGRASDLPLGVVQRIAQLARSRRIPGTNKFARVCRQWQDASSSKEAEQLQLLVDLHIMSAEEVARACRWMSMHGGSVQTLVVSAESKLPLQQTWFTTAAGTAALRNLQRLEVDQKHSLLMLAPVLGRLPQLQHLGAVVAAMADPHDSWEAADGEDMAEGVLTNWQWYPWKPLPDMERLCPQLTSLRLRLDVEVEEVDIFEYPEGDYDGLIILDKRLPRLLPDTLQHLTLSKAEAWQKVVLRSDALTHLVDLRQLTLEGVDMDSDGCRAVAAHLAALHELRVREPRVLVPDDDPMLLLGPKLIEYTPCGGLTAAAAPQLVHLTKFVWTWSRPLGQGRAEALAALTGLRELVMEGTPNQVASEVAAAVRLAAGLLHLRHLQLDMLPDSRGEIAASLEQCTQLTSLSLWLLPNYGRRHLPVPQQLTGLQRLTVPLQLLEQEACAWLAPLTALTRLGVFIDWEMLVAAKEAETARQQMQQGGSCHHARVEGALQQVQVWPPGMRRVVVWVGKLTPWQCVAPHHWQHTPSAPGSVPFEVYFEMGDRSGNSEVARGWARPLRPCPHLPGVRELQGEVQGG
jgi:hypothetical protein